MAGAHARVCFDERAAEVLTSAFTTDKHTLQGYRHVIVDVTGARFKRRGSAQSRVNTLLRGVVGLSFDEQRGNFEQVIELTDNAPAGNVAAQSARAIAERALQVIGTRESARPAPAAASEPEEDFWDDDEDYDE